MEHWECPECNRSFKTTNQWHSCNLVDISEHLKGKPENIVAAIETLLEIGLSFEGTTVTVVKSSIQLKIGSNYASLQPGKSNILIWFFSSQEIDEFPVYRTTRLSGKRVLNELFVESPEEVDEQLTNWIRESYKIVKQVQSI